MVRMSTWSSAFLSPAAFLSASSLSLISRSTSLMSSLSSSRSPLSLFVFFDLKWSCKILFYSLKFFVSIEFSTPWVWNACRPLFLLVPARRLPSSFMIGNSFKAVLSIMEIDSSKILKGISRTGEFSLMYCFWYIFSFISDFVCLPDLSGSAPPRSVP